MRLPQKGENCEGQHTCIQTRTVDIKTAHRVRKPGGLIRVFADSTWTEWLPIYTWVIDHPEGVIVVDSIGYGWRGVQATKSCRQRNERR